MFKFIWFSVQFFTGLTLGILINSQLLYPLIYGFPRSLIWFFKGKLRLTGVLFNFIGPIIISIAIAAFGFISGLFFPFVINFINSPGFGIGDILSVIILLFNMFKPEMDEDFRNSMARFLIETE